MAETGPEEEFEEPANVRILKRVVYIMGIMLVVGTIVVIGTIIYRAINYDASRSASSSPTKAFEDVMVDIAPGSQVGEIELDGNRMAVHISQDGKNEIILIDVRKGTLLGRVKLNDNKE
ncbi:MAG: hypothetical protein ACR2OJ_13995 [Hyphomicrobiales bacterium]